MSNWTLFGDVNPLDEGGVFVRKEYDNPEYDFQKTTCDVIYIAPNPESENLVFAGRLSIDTADYEDKSEELFGYYGGKPQSNEEMAYMIADYYGLVELSASSYTNPYAQYSMDVKEYLIDKHKLAKELLESEIPEEYLKDYCKPKERERE